MLHAALASDRPRLTIPIFFQGTTTANHTNDIKTTEAQPQDSSTIALTAAAVTNGAMDHADEGPGWRIHRDDVRDKIDYCL